MQIVIVSERWGSSVGIGAIRAMKMAKYLLREGHQIVVLYGTDLSKTQSEDAAILELVNQSSFSHFRVFIESSLVRLIRRAIRRSNREKCVKTDATREEISTSSNLGKILRKIRSFFYRVIYLRFESAHLARRAYRRVKRLHLSPDIIFSTYGPLEPLQLARIMKKKHKELIWIADFRDPIPWYDDSKIVYKSNENLQKKFCASADIVTVISNGMKTEFEKLGINNVHVIHNGFDVEERLNNYLPVGRGIMQFTYTGNLYQGKRDLEPFVRAINQLIDTCDIEGERIIVNYAGESTCEFWEQMADLDPSVKAVTFGYVSRNESLRLQQESDILLHATWNSIGNTGVLTGKIFEYLLAGKPIITLVSGTMPDSEIGKIIEQSGVGYVYEEAGQNDIELLKKYIKHQYEMKLSTGKVEYSCNSGYLSQFEYSNIAKKLIMLVIDKAVF